ncbi:MAG TPA: 5'-3' exonuclease H3TH domain-containing protein [Spirochaetota bacterium]|nr:5'-3' exonuclease H3TH domain-containing protein [Spirochaetota bacterium]
MDKILYIVDGHGLIYRAYYAFIHRPLVTAKGENTSAVFGYMRMILRLINERHPAYLVCVYDSKGPTFRNELYPPYKAKRLKAPEDLHPQVEVIKKLTRGLGIASVELPGYEADDLIGTISQKAVDMGMRCSIVSSDKDVLQLVDERIDVYASKKGNSETELLDEKRVTDLWGVPPRLIVDMLALMGDQSDNIPGVRGIGKSGALKLIREFGGFGEIYENLDMVKEQRTRRLLEEAKEDAFLSRKLLTIRRDAPIEFSMEEYSLEGFPKEEGISILLDKELDTIVDELTRAPLSKPKYQKRGS